MIACFDCGCNAEILYLWDFNFDPDDGLVNNMLCADCVGKRLGHELKDDDFADPRYVMSIGGWNE
jgi:hypothetical protein